jgi:hypothetical protein
MFSILMRKLYVIRLLAYIGVASLICICTAKAEEYLYFPANMATISSQDILETNVSYIITVSGTWSAWAQEDWAQNPNCGYPLLTSFGWTGLDAEFWFSDFVYSAFPESCDQFPVHRAYGFKMNTGSGFLHYEPIGGIPVVPNLDHTYRYLVSGGGTHIEFSNYDSDYHNNYGGYTIEVSSTGIVSTDRTTWGSIKSLFQ